jgi:nicotinate-nucleotide adenylyltransferase
MRIGLFGGSFDPPHRGHLALARLARQRFGLDRVLFAPVGSQPLKRDRPRPPGSPARSRGGAEASFADRLAMTRLAIEGEPGMEISLIDAPRDDGRPNYTVDSIPTLRSELPPEHHIFCLMGADSFLSIGRWHRAADLLVACDFVVAARPGFDLSRLTADLPAGISVAACDASEPDGLLLSLRDQSGREARLYLLPYLAEEASASAIRAAVQQGSDAASVIDPRVADYIRDHRLYRPVDRQDATS